MKVFIVVFCAVILRLSYAEYDCINVLKTKNGCKTYEPCENMKMDECPIKFGLKKSPCFELVCGKKISPVVSKNAAVTITDPEEMPPAAAVSTSHREVLIVAVLLTAFITILSCYVVYKMVHNENNGSSRVCCEGFARPSELVGRFFWHHEASAPAPNSENDEPPKYEIAVGSSAPTNPV